MISVVKNLAKDEKNKCVVDRSEGEKSLNEGYKESRG